MREPPLLPLVEKPAIDIAREYYKKWGDVGKTFHQEVAHYAENAMVFIRPDLFMLAKIIDLRPLDAEGNPIGEELMPAWYIRMAVGRLSELLLTLPVYLPTVCFHRHGDLRLRTYSLKRIARFVASQELKGEK
jgi:hypothetical protein